MSIKTRILTRNDSAANWELYNPVLGKGEMGLEIDTGLFKFGDGVTAWKLLSYANEIPEVEVTTVEVTAGDNSVGVESIPTADENGKVSNVEYEVKVKVSAQEGNTVEVKEDGLFVAAPEAYNDAEVRASIAALEGLVGETAVSEQIDSKIAGLNLAETYAAKQHGHAIAEVEGLQAALDGKQAAGDYATKAEAEGYANAKDEAIAAAKKAGDDAQSAVNALGERVTATEGSIEKLNGDVTVEGSVDKKIAAAINDFATKISDNNTLDTFKELVDYIGEHGGEAAEMASAIEALETKVGTKSVATQIAEAIEGANLGQYATTEKVAAVEGKVDALAGIKSVAQGELAIDEAGQLGVVAVSKDKVTGLAEALEGKVDALSTEYEGKQVAWTLLSPENQAKLSALVIGENGIQISGKVNADNVEELNTWITKNRDSIGGLISVEKEAKLDGIEAGAQVNVLEGVSVNGVALAISNKIVNIPVGGAEALGVVKSAEGNNQVSIAADGVMSVNGITTDKLVQGEATFIIDGGNAQG